MSGAQGGGPGGGATLFFRGGGGAFVWIVELTSISATIRDTVGSWSCHLQVTTRDIRVNGIPRERDHPTGRSMRPNRDAGQIRACTSYRQTH